MYLFIYLHIYFTYLFISLVYFACSWMWMSFEHTPHVPVSCVILPSIAAMPGVSMHVISSLFLLLSFFFPFFSFLSVSYSVAATAASAAKIAQRHNPQNALDTPVSDTAK